MNNDMLLVLKGQLESLDADICCLADSIDSVGQGTNDSEAASLLHCLSRYAVGLAFTIEDMLKDYCP